MALAEAIAPGQDGAQLAAGLMIERAAARIGAPKEAERAAWIEEQIRALFARAPAEAELAALGQALETKRTTPAGILAALVHGEEFLRF